MKKILLTVLVVALSTGCTTNQTKSKEFEVDSTKVTLKLHKDKYLAELMQLIRLFDNYYHSTEEMLDSINVEDDQYLEDKAALNSLFNELEYNSNHKH